MFNPWPSIQSFYNVRKTLDYLGQAPKIRYFSKVKLHGTNCAVNVLEEDGVRRIEAQSRNKLLTPNDDPYGFARWVAHHEDFWLQCWPGTYFMEWCGPGVQPGVGVSRAPNRFAALFAYQDAGNQTYYVSPNRLRLAFNNAQPPSSLYVIPWYNEYEIDFSNEDSIQPLNEAVLAIEACCPFAKEHFGVEGVGEGLVLYPTNCGYTSEAASLVFKAKGQEHRVVAQKQAVEFTVPNAESIIDLVKLVCTEARLKQGAVEIGLDKRLTGKFITWVCADVEKECAAEILASNLTFDQIKTELTRHARTWYLARV